jgi:transposase
MAAPYSQDLRDRVLTAADRGMATIEIARTFQVCPSWVRRVKQRRREFGECGPRPVGSPGVCKVDRARLAQLVRDDPDATLVELRERIGVRCALSTICTALKQIGLSFKKRSSTRRSRSGRTWSNTARPGGPGVSGSRPAA